MSENKFTPGPGTLVFDNRKMHEGEYKGPFEVDYSVYLRCRERETALKERNKELLDALEEFTSACDTAPPIEFIQRIGMACETAKKAIEKAKGESCE